MNYRENITAWYNKLNKTNIKFMYFNASDITKPKIRTVFKQFTINNLTNYIVECNDSWNIYSESNIKYLVNLIPTDEDVINGGDHIDFSIIKLRTGDAVVKTHKTIYTNLDNFIFDRSTPQLCNFIFKESYLHNFNSIKADLLNGNL
jgi:hypothetical protein